MANLDWKEISFLVVEDNHHMAALINIILRSIGVRDIRTATNGAGALALLKTRSVDVALVDVVMDVMDGVAFTKAVRNEPDSVDSFLPIIIVTGYSDIGTVHRVIDAGANAVILKPIAPKTLLVHVARTLLAPRPYVRTTSFFGPNRRHPVPKPHRGQDRRKKSPSTPAD